MKLKYIIIIFLYVNFASCSGDNNSNPPQLYTDLSAVELSPLGGEQTVGVTCTGEWSISSDAQWITISKESESSFKIKAGTNNGSLRRGMVTVAAQFAQVYVHVTQSQLGITQRDSVTLVALYHSTNGSAWFSKWNLRQPLQQWSGVTVSNGRVVALTLPSNNLSSTLPEEFHLLDALQFCDLSNNAISGNIGSCISELKALRYLDISDNKFTGTAPAISELKALVMLDFSKNEYTGSLPEVASLTKLEYAGFSQNHFSGALPETWSGLSLLNTIDLSQNNFTGKIPSSWAMLSRLQILYLHGNALDGVLPDFLENLPELSSLALDANNFTGSIPELLGDLYNLDELWLSDNRLTGNIPSSLYNHLYWDSWQPHVCRQQSGYGFDNCTPFIASSQVVNISKNSAKHPSISKEKWRKKVLGSQNIFN